jgi:hypothetical protein
MACRRINACGDGATGFAARHRYVVHLRVYQRPPAEQHLAVVAVGRGDGGGSNAVMTQNTPQQSKGMFFFFYEARVDFLEGQDIGVRSLDERKDAGKVVALVGAHAAVDVPGHHPHSRGAILGQCATPRTRAASACPAMIRASQSRAAAIRRAKSAGFGSTMKRNIWCPKADMARSPGRRPSAVPAR